ncbi:bacillithiol biosynthesis cysteine-adding enzyme BshC [Capnocytophaga haemolytica]|uniref:Putative cysteine ligase BshC n=1 Tax=Capnocytophaga haemolytica TaxID=45243 RepID=A0AAX2GTX1_9FLAO|nr:bacillithiol biosynthesis cysteine-adding enzyme BshC [Capnocytophaga haemolytica]AMD85512.1 bacillithiol biosynthesis cysteine-adding enzyme BshC [Capnocytophaga haemolytica]SFO18346.1 bacillithiol biosynthesis cysteine-adding enzyme BshC [Capnocytophaga haemolytica]SNV00754.1 Uncharacterized protein conserved in bacteria [Capnocytophaga haemolytica]
MVTDFIPYENIRFFSRLIKDYVLEKGLLRPFYNRFPTPLNFEEQIKEKALQFSEPSRKKLVERLKEQYLDVQTSDKVLKNITLLGEKNTFTITTGHQLSLFTGHLYFIFKIVSVINTTKQLSKLYPDYNFVPVYWMATEDHDFEEINHFHLSGGKTICWNSEQKGATGDFSTRSLSIVFEAFSNALGLGKNAENLRVLFRDSYLENSTLARATRYLVNALFQEYGVVIVDGNDRELKREFTPYMKNDLLHHIAYQEVSKQAEKLYTLDNTYPIQVNPREINLFYLTTGSRHRIERRDEGFDVVDTKIKFTKDKILRELEEYPERFSPNVILRPMYQEVILPNLAYIGGGGEIAYWLELKGFFERERVVFPMLMLRNSAMLISERQQAKIQKLGLSVEDLFLKSNDLKDKKVRALSTFPIDFTPQKEALQKQFSDLYILAAQTDVSFMNAVRAQEVKQLKGLTHLEKRLLKAQKRKLSDELERVVVLQRELFPNGGLQERFSNFTDFYLEVGEEFIPTLISDFDPFDFRFVVVKLV